MVDYLFVLKEEVLLLQRLERAKHKQASKKCSIVQVYTTKDLQKH